MRRLFVEAPKRLEVGFYTSSIEKFLQARMVLQSDGLILRHFISSQEPYEEDYNRGQTELLRRAIETVKRRLGVNSLFFVEDTAVRIDALSDPQSDFPGLQVKEWFAQTTFETLNRELLRRGSNRTATITSDIALHLPGLGRLVLMQGRTFGRIADTPPHFPKSDQYPWLSPNNFSGWFVPANSERRLGEMSFEESLGHDFRVRSLTALVDRLEEYTAVLNLGGHSYSVRRPRGDTATLSLFKEDVRLHVVIGKVCAGKTTLGQYLATRYRYQSIEASDMVRMLAEEHGIDAPTPYYRAKELLHSKGPDIVARAIVGLYGGDLQERSVITGFRTIEEVQFIRREIPNCRVVLVDASERTRFERHLNRGRPESMGSLEEFRQHDRQQWAFGLLPIAHDLADLRIENEGTIKDYHEQVEALIAGRHERVAGVSVVRRSAAALRSSRLYRCLRALASLQSPATCPEIACLTDRDTPIMSMEHTERISPRHVNWVLRSVPDLARRVDAKGERLRYCILPAGEAYLEVVDSMVGAR